MNKKLFIFLTWSLRIIILIVIIFIFKHEYILKKISGIQKKEVAPTTKTAIVKKEGQEKEINKDNKENKEATDQKIEKNIQKKIEIKKTILLEVPFTSQAPYAEWSDDRFQDACEEASVIMAMAWVRGEKLSPAKTKQEIIAMSKYEDDNFGNYHDTDARDTIDRLFNGYYQYQQVELKYNFSISDIEQELAQGNLVLVPTNGQKLNNPHYTPPGPETHMLVIVGYDPQRQEFITNDPGTKRGKKYRYNVSVVYDAAIDYPTGQHEKIINPRKAIIIVKK